MSNLLYLGIAVLGTIIGCVFIWLRNRRPTSVRAQIEEFARELDALAPGRRPTRAPRRPSKR